MAKQCWKGGTLLAPLPAVLVSCGTLERPNLLTVAWTGILATHPAQTYVSLRKTRFSYELISNTREFVINLVPASLVKACDYCGIYSGRTKDKFAACALTPAPAFHVSAPLVAECPVSLECRVSRVIPLGSHDMFLSEILSVDAEETLMDKNGRLALEKAELLTFVHGAYYAIGAKLGSLGYSVKKKHTGAAVPTGRAHAPAAKPAVKSAAKSPAEKFTTAKSPAEKSPAKQKSDAVAKGSRPGGKNTPSQKKKGPLS